MMAAPYELTGKVIRVLFQSEEEAHTIALVRIKEKNFETDETEMVIAGVGVGIEKGETYKAHGRLVEHPRFGKQMKADWIRRVVPMTKRAAVRFLTNGSFPGIGQKTAQKIADSLGDDCIDQIVKHPSILSEVDGLKEKQARVITERLNVLYGVDQLLLFLAPFDVTPRLASKIHKEYEGRAMETIEKNPYALMYDVQGIGFKTADAIAAHFGIQGIHPERIAAAVLYVLELEQGNGHLYVTAEQLEAEMPRIIGADPGEALVTALESLAKEERVVIEDGVVYHPRVFRAERKAAEELARIMATSTTEDVDMTTIFDAVGRVEEMFSIEYATQQREAIELALKSPLMVLTGGPGTGKTTVVRGIIHALSDVFDWKLDPVPNQPFPFVLAAPTGRAAKRLSESTGLPASTIHRLLKFDGSSFQVDETNPLVGKVLIVDEASMIDIFLFRSLLKAVPNGMKILFVGDRDQLPSVGPGQVLADLMATEGIPVVRLDVVHRQASESSILRLAHSLNAKKMPEDLLASLPDRRFYTANQETALQAICQMAGAALRKGYSPFDIQVLAPTYRGVCGIDGLNEALQNVFNPKSSAREVKHGTRIYRNGDKVLQLVNNAEENVYNGDIGEITNIFYAKENVDKVDKIYIRFDQTEVEYNRSEWDQFTHAYAITIHKSQGSEFPIVLMPVFFNGGFRSSRNLIYTAVTRAKKSLLLFGDVRALEAATREEEPVRRTKLVERLGGKS